MPLPKPTSLVYGLILVDFARCQKSISCMSCVHLAWQSMQLHVYFPGNLFINGRSYIYLFNIIRSIKQSFASLVINSVLCFYCKSHLLVFLCKVSVTIFDDKTVTSGQYNFIKLLHQASITSFFSSCSLLTIAASDLSWVVS